ncbi:MAG: hypothetical protein N4A45_02430 [Flavobacteriales bacterium]|jgi:hypothetical protein|nr:hypothetical protein [Flavobacteriales bacterium]
MKNTITFFVFLAFTNSVIAQQINNIFAFRNDNKNSVSIHLEMDPALVGGISYSRVMNLSLGKSSKKILGNIGWKTYQMNYSDFNINLSTTVLNNTSFNMIVNIGAENKFLKNTVHKANIQNIIVSLMPGYFSDKWYMGIELMHKRLLGAYFKHTDYYRSIFPNVKDGWYNYENNYWNLSLNCGARMAKNWDMDLRVGYRMPSNFKSYKPYLIPYFVNIGINHRF